MDKSVATAPRTIKKVRIGRNTYSRAEIWVGVLLLVPSIVFLVFTFVIPVVQVIELSLTNFNMATGEMSFVGIRNYEYLLGNDRFWLAMWNTCKYSAAKLIFDTSLALFIAVQLDKNVPLKKFLRSTYFAPVVVPMVASSLIWIWFYDPQVGPFNQILSFLGLPELKWLYSEHTAMISILLFSIWKGLGYNVVLFLSGLQNISDSYLEAARLDGGQAPLSMGFSRQEYWSGQPFPYPGDLPNPGNEPGSPALQADSLLSDHQEIPEHISTL